MRHQLVSAVALISLASQLASAEPIPILPEGAEEKWGLYMNRGAKHYAYDVASGLFTYSAENGIFFNGAAVGAFDVWSGTFSWSALINQSGELVEGGLMSWRADYGSGLDIRATGKVIGFNPRITCSSGLCISDIPYATIETTYIDPVLEPLFGRFWQSELWEDIFSPWIRDFACDGGCGFSGHVVKTYDVSEPTTLGLFALAFAVVGLACRRVPARPGNDCSHRTSWRADHGRRQSEARSPDRDRIDVNDADELRNWSKSLNTTPEKLKEAVKAVGTTASKMRERLQGR
jgi:hypothetical protein